MACRSGFVACLLVACLAQAAHGQVIGNFDLPAQPLADSADQLQEIIVSARKQTERLQDVPASVIALDSKTLESSGALTLEDISHEVPGLSVVSAGPGQNQIILRGLSSGASGPMVGYYLDDVPVSASTNVLSTNNMDAALFDLDRVEVLRGPQGTLYGASAMGGTIKYVTTQPDPRGTTATIKADLSHTQNGGMNGELDTILNEPISSTAAIRVVGFVRDYDGYIDRYPTDPTNYLAALSGPVDRNVNTEKTYGGRVLLRWQPIDQITVTPSALYQRTDLGGAFQFDSPPGTFDDPIQNRLVKEPYDDRASLYSLVVNGDFAPVSITSATSYFERSVFQIQDESRNIAYFFTPPETYVYPTPFNLLFNNYNFTEELRASATVGPVHGLVGLFYSHFSGTGTVSQSLLGFDQAFGDPFGNQPYWFASDFSLRDKQKALFGELTYDLTHALQITMGGRFYRQTQSLPVFSTGFYNGGVSTFTTTSSSASGVTPKYGASYHINPDVMTYVTASKGFREGGAFFTPIPASLCSKDLAALGLSSPPTSYQPDTLWNYELGAKTEWLNNRLTVNGDIYYIDWSNIQQNVVLPTCTFNFTANAGTAVSKGAELEMRYQVVRDLRLSLSGAYNQAQLISTVPGAQGSPHQELENAPRWMGSASAEYRQPLGGSLTGTARVDYSVTGHAYNLFDSTNPYYNQAGYSLMNIRTGVESGIWQSSLYVTNLFNKHAQTGLPNSYSSNLPTQQQYALNRPRTVGITLRVDF